jgi:oligoribonuclease
MAIRYLWFDTEYSSTQLESAGILQAAVVGTDEQLRPIAPSAWPDGLREHERREHGAVLWVKPRTDLVLSDFVRALTPLLEGCAAYGRAIEEVDALLAATVDAICGPPPAKEKDRPMLAGNSVHLDWLLARRELPRFSARLHYRIMDVTALKMEWALLGGAKLEKEVAGRHDAYHDVIASIAELAYYRRHLRRTEPAG